MDRAMDSAADAPLYVYEELAPPPELAPVVACLWRQHAGPGDHVQRVVPDGCVDILWVVGPTGSTLRTEVAGPDTGPQMPRLPAGTEITGVRFRPGTAAGVLGVPLHALRDEQVPLAELWGRDAEDQLVERLATAARPEDAAARAVAERLRRGAGPATTAAGADALARALLADQGPGVVRRVAADLGLSERQLHRRCLDAFGYGPKTVQKVLRFQSALAAAREGHDLARVAAETGYADQAHLARDVRSLAGAPMSALLA